MFAGYSLVISQVSECQFGFSYEWVLGPSFVRWGTLSSVSERSPSECVRVVFLTVPVFSMGLLRSRCVRSRVLGCMFARFGIVSLLSVSVIPSVILWPFGL